jgi:dUTP pyrophosphatase
MKFTFVKTRADAVTPTKAYPSDVGYDLTAIDVFKKLSQQTTLYETGLIVTPPEGYYVEILPRSSISKTGYVISNSVGIIDPSYTGSLKIAVTKVDDSFPDLTLPFCKFQLVLRKLYEAELVEVGSVRETERGDGGFGSTG